MNENYEDEDHLDLEEGGSGVKEEMNISNHSLGNDDVDSKRNGRMPLTKRCKSRREDGISMLPNSIIHQILSLLPMQDAVKTGVLSKRWQHLWTSIPTLNFCFHGDNRQSFFKFIDKTLNLYSSPKVKKFTLSFDFPLNFWDDEEKDFFASVGQCLRFATRHDVEDLSLVLSDEKTDTSYFQCHAYYTIPHFLYAHSSLTTLTTRFCNYEPMAEVCWASLKVLNIAIGGLTEDGFQRILAGTPLLEHLELNRCWGIDSIQIGSTIALKKLVISSWEPFHLGSDLETLQISILGVKSLELSDFWLTKCQLLDVSSLVEATLNFVVSDDDILLQEHVGMFNNLLQKVTLVPKLTVGPLFIEALRSCRKKELASIWHSLNLKCKLLILAVCFDKRSLRAISSFLKGSSNLEKLIIDLTDYDYSDHWFDEDEEENYWSSKDGYFQHSFKQLKTIEIVGLDPAKNDRNNSVFQLAEFLLGKAGVLEKMVIRKFPGTKAHDYYGVTQKLIRFYRCSPNAQVILPK